MVFSDTGLWVWCLIAIGAVLGGRLGCAFAVLSGRSWRGGWESGDLAGISSSSPWFVIVQSLPGASTWRPESAHMLSMLVLLV